ncbi:hypothetical protein P9E08_08595 [Bacillus mojavensis]|uniref:hypothetical protein n=1 Tax=Bacillus mojavensis TaxID=72360 RepID=UPI002DB7105C|nr:hypothetical protein [Bacillus mojavensis]MEC1625437.1 hypothetical protein [Bacillus mojavensis]
MADKRVSTDFIVDEMGNAEDVRKPAGEINVKVNVEVSDAITGLKALQREAKAATKALAELREEQAKGPYKGYIAGERVDGKKLVWLDEGEKFVPITEPTVYLDGKAIGKASGKGTHR